MPMSRVDIGQWKYPGIVFKEMSSGCRVGKEGSKLVGSSVVSAVEAVK
jgi:hypothetical protein